ncbi:M50 family metallopeptidase [Rhodococcus marinonascens]|uniref:M50 family metallopeptidase n=1 Tax=Rhodococcus marinonascens TaxID=38311 RepID=UPI00093234F2|nr:M50 family metallopeptidase [Rhodococcus marinonascens]
MNEIQSLWERMSAVSPAPATWIVQVASVVAIVLVLEPHAWRLTRNVVTIVHEGAHLLVALLFGRRLKGVRLHSDTSGVAISSGKPTGLGVVLMTFAGYVGPAVLGLGAAWVLGSGHAVAVLWIGVAALAAMLILVRNLFGLFSLSLVGALLFALVWFGTQDQQVAAAYFITLFMLVAATRPVIELQRHRAKGAAPNSDADQLARLTHIPGLVWVGLFLVVTVSCLVLGGGWILRPVIG